MAAMNYDDFGDDAVSGSLAGLINWAGAFLSILLIAGLATWGWKLMVRDVTGVPVVRALEGPMRIAPADPGGEAAEYQGLSVNRIAEERIDDSMADRVVLAPQPTTLDEAEDLPMAELAPLIEATVDEAVGAQPVVVEAPIELESDALDAATVEVSAAPTFSGAEESKLVEAVAVEETSATDLAVMAALGLEATPASLQVPAEQVGIQSTPRPRIRPADRRVASLTPVMNDVTGEIDPTSIPVGTRLVQLGAYGSAEVARAEWANVMAQFGDYMVGKDRVVQEAQSGGRTFWRLRAMGFGDLADARRFCSVLVAQGSNCIPVTQE